MMILRSLARLACALALSCHGFAQSPDSPAGPSAPPAQAETTDAATASPSPANDHASRLAQAEAEGQLAFSLRTGATPEEYDEFLNLLRRLVNSGEMTRERALSAPEIQAEAARVEDNIRNFQPPVIDPETGLKTYDEARTAAQLASTWVNILADFSNSERAAEDTAFSRLRDDQTKLQQLQNEKSGDARLQWLIQLQQLRIAAAVADYAAAQNTGIRDSTARMEDLRLKLETRISSSIRNQVTFPQAVLDARTAELKTQIKTFTDLGVSLAGSLDQVDGQLATARPDTPERYWLSARSSSLQRQIQSANFIRIILEVQMRLWQERYNLWNSQDPEAFVEARRSITSTLSDLQTWQPLVRGRLGELRQQQSGILAGAPDGATKPPKAVTDTFSAEEAALNQLGDAFDSAMNLVSLSRMDINDREERLGVAKRVERTAVRVANVLGNIWNFPLFQLSDSMTVNGSVVEQTRSVTVGMLAIAVFILAVGAAFSSRFCRWFAARLTRRFKLEQNTSVILEKFTHYTLIVILVLVALGIVRIPLTIFALLGGATAIAIGFGAQQLFNNLISGVILLFERPIRIGDRIEVENFSGTVTAIGTRCSRLQRPDGVEILIPNSLVLQNTLVNWTLSDKFCRLELKIGVAYGSPVEKTAALIEAAVRSNTSVLTTPEPMVLFHDFAESALVFRALYWIDSAVPGAILTTPSELRFTIHRKLAEAGIAMPFPQRDVHFDTNHPVPVTVFPSTT